MPDSFYVLAEREGEKIKKKKGNGRDKKKERLGGIILTIYIPLNYIWTVFKVIK